MTIYETFFVNEGNKISVQFNKPTKDSILTVLVLNLPS